MKDQSGGANSTGSGAKVGGEEPLPCAEQSDEDVRAWCARLSVGDCVAVRIFDVDAMVRYDVTSVLEVVDGRSLVLWSYGTFNRDGRNVVIPAELQLVQPTAAVREAAAKGRAYGVPAD